MQSVLKNLTGGWKERKTMTFKGEDVTALLKGWREATGLNKKVPLVFTANGETAYVYRGDNGSTLGMVNPFDLKGN